MMHNYLLPLQELLEAQGNADFAKQMKAYMKDQFEFLGLKQAPRRVILKTFFKQHGLPDWELVPELVQELYVQPEREYHYCAIELLIKFKKHWQVETLPLIEWMLVNHAWWDSVDYISADIAGVFFQKYPELIEEKVEEWIQSENLWLRRTAIIFQRKYKTKTDEALLFRNIEACAHEKEFFIAKGIGWALRAHGKTFPNQVIDFVNRAPLQALSKREALKHLGKKK